MGSIGLRRQLHRQRRRLAAILAVLVCSTALAAHHSGIAMGDAHHESGVSAAVEMCMAALVAVGAAVVAVAVALITLGRWRPPLTVAPSALAFWASPPLPRARAGPALLSLLCVSRR